MYDPGKEVKNLSRWRQKKAPCNTTDGFCNMSKWLVTTMDGHFVLTSRKRTEQWRMHRKVKLGVVFSPYHTIPFFVYVWALRKHINSLSFTHVIFHLRKLNKSMKCLSIL